MNVTPARAGGSLQGKLHKHDSLMQQLPSSVLSWVLLWINTSTVSGVYISICLHIRLNEKTITAQMFLLSPKRTGKDQAVKWHFHTSWAHSWFYSSTTYLLFLDCICYEMQRNLYLMAIFENVLTIKKLQSGVLWSASSQPDPWDPVAENGLFSSFLLVMFIFHTLLVMFIFQSFFIVHNSSFHLILCFYWPKYVYSFNKLLLPVHLVMVFLFSGEAFSRRPFWAMGHPILQCACM